MADLNTEIEQQVYSAARKVMGDDVEVKSQLEQQMYNALEEAGVGGGGGSGKQSNPVGTLIWFAGSSAPEGYLLCNGDAISRTTYAALFAVLGTTYGAGDESTTFNLPNLIDKFIEGSTTAGIEKLAGLPNITGDFTHTDTRYGYDNGTYSGALKVKENISCSGLNAASNSLTYPAGWTFDASQSSAIYGASNTVQPPALTALPCIKY